MTQLDPASLTLGQLLDAYIAYQRDRWDHTCAIVSAWSKQPVRNPYRRAKRSYLRPSELYALQHIVQARKKKQ